MQNFGQQSYEYTKVDGRTESQSELIKVEGETKSSQENAADIYIKGGNKAQIWHLNMIPPV